MRKIYLVPNFVTTVNLLCGFYSVIVAFRGDYVTASWLIIAAGVFDMLDGRIARLAKATSSFGVEYDSVSDVMSFGLAPAILGYLAALQGFGREGVLIAFMFLACGALRIARFNVSSELISKAYFQGLPIPAAAGTLVTFLIYNDVTGWLSGRLFDLFVLGLMLSLSVLMVSTIPFPSFKELHWRSRATFGYLLGGVLIILFIVLNPSGSLFLLAASYVILSLLWSVYLLSRGMLPSQRIRKAAKK